MSEIFYNTNHSVFRIKRDNIPSLLARINEAYETCLDESDVSSGSILIEAGFGVSHDDDGNIVDIYGDVSSVDEDDWTFLEKEVGRFVEEGSYLVFYETENIFMIRYERNEEGVVQGSHSGVVTVARTDMIRILSLLQKNPHVTPAELLEFERKYGVEEEDEG